MKVSAFVGYEAVGGVFAIMVTWYITEDNRADAHKLNLDSLCSIRMKNTAWFTTMIASGGMKTESANRPLGLVKTMVNTARALGLLPPMHLQVISPGG